MPTHHPEPTSQCRMHAVQRLLIRPRHDSRPPRLLVQMSSANDHHHHESLSPSPTHSHAHYQLLLPDHQHRGTGGGERPVIVQLHQPIGFVCCQCRYRSSGSYCSNPDRPDCPHRGCPRCGECPILFTPPRPSRATRYQHWHHGDLDLV
ncbi:hypothetical protein F5X99DRAFT_408827 [Biscogniauxia marginata]|nr:hypothetical protein F5X99DRAFT_408827 [Biscogniauxia marginata]